MANAPWLTIIGLDETGPDGLCRASQDALAGAVFVIGAARHLELLPDTAGDRVTWPVPFADGIDIVMARRGEPTVVLASGDPFWFGAGTPLTRQLEPGEWRAFPGRSTFSLAAARLGWPLEGTRCLGLHAAPLTRLRKHLAPGRRIIMTLRNGEAVSELGQYLQACGFGQTRCTVLEALGGPRENLTRVTASDLDAQSFRHPVSVAVEIAGSGQVLPLACGRSDDWFDNDGQITKRPVRALTLSALAPRPYEHLWDIGGGSGSIGIEWMLSDPSLTATAFEANAERAERIRSNAAKLGVDRLEVRHGRAPDVLTACPPPDAVFVGGGLTPDLLAFLEALPAGTRLVANAVTLESEALLTQAQGRLGGDLLRASLSNAVPIGPKQGWRAAFPITQWSHVL